MIESVLLDDTCRIIESARDYAYRANTIVNSVRRQLLPWTLYRELARYSVLNGSEQIFQAKYLTYLPTEEELIKEIEQQKLIFELQKEED